MIASGESFLKAVDMLQPDAAYLGGASDLSIFK